MYKKVVVLDNTHSKSYLSIKIKANIDYIKLYYFSLQAIENNASVLDINSLKENSLFLNMSAFSSLMRI